MTQNMLCFSECYEKYCVFSLLFYGVFCQRQMGQVGFHAHADLFMEARPLNRCHLPESSQHLMTSVQLLLSPES